MLKQDIDVQIRYSALFRMSKWDFECQNAIFGLSLIVKIGFRLSIYDVRPHFKSKNRILMSKYDIRPCFECQNGIFNVKIRYSASVRML